MGADTEVLIVGAGPVGLTLAIDLGQKGVRCTLIERKEAPQFLPKMERCNARTMEIFRRMGLAGKIRAAGLDRNVPMDVYVILAMNQPPLLRLPYPSVAEAQREIDACTDGSMPLEPYQLISQYTLEPLLKSVAQALPGVTVRYGCEFLSLEHDATGVTARVRNGAGPVASLRAAYLVGCDGGASQVRHELGIGLRGEANLLQLRQALYCCEDLYERIPIANGPGKGRHYHVADDSATLLIMQDSTRHWTLHAIVGEDEDMARQFERTVGVPVKYDMLYVGEWKQNLLLADQSAEGQAAREHLAGVADIEQRKTNEMIGAELGYRYVGSPIVWEEPGGPEHLFREYVPTTWPGARLPHVWLDGHVALQDRLGPGYTLLRLGATGEDGSALQQSFAAYGAPFDVLHVADDAARDVYGYDLILLRPDLHIVWRGNPLAIEPDELAAISTGHL